MTANAHYMIKWERQIIILTLKDSRIVEVDLSRSSRMVHMKILHSTNELSKNGRSNSKAGITMRVIRPQMIFTNNILGMSKVKNALKTSLKISSRVSGINHQEVMIIRSIQAPTKISIVHVLQIPTRTIKVGLPIQRIQTSHQIRMRTTHMVSSTVARNTMNNRGLRHIPSKRPQKRKLERMIFTEATIRLTTSSKRNLSNTRQIRIPCSTSLRHGVLAPNPSRKPMPNMSLKRAASFIIWIVGIISGIYIRQGLASGAGYSNIHGTRLKLKTMLGKERSGKESIQKMTDYLNRQKKSSKNRLESQCPGST